MKKAEIQIHPRRDGEPGFLVTSKDPLLPIFVVVEQDPNTDFSTTMKILHAYLDINYPDTAPHLATLEPADPKLLAILESADVHIEENVPRLH